MLTFIQCGVAFPFLFMLNYSIPARNPLTGKSTEKFLERLGLDRYLACFLCCI
jgi:hypothetical protein